VQVTIKQLLNQKKDIIIVKMTGFFSKIVAGLSVSVNHCLQDAPVKNFETGNKP
jgi:hypothetical protein